MSFIRGFSDGFIMGAGLIVAIGAQNAYVLRQGIRREHRGVIALLCSFSDAMLITLGIAGMGFVFTGHPLITKAAAYAGSVYLLWFSLRSFLSAFKGSVMDLNGVESATSLKTAVLTVCALTYLNPHVYLDTVVMLGGFGAGRPPAERLFFGMGAAAASFIWFFSLAYLSRFLAPFFKSPRAWKVFDISVGFVMLYVSVMMVMFGYRAG